MTMAAKTTVPQSVLDAAAAWLARQDRGFSAVEQSEFEAWRSAHPSHAAALVRLERSWGAMDRPLQTGLADEVLRGLAIKARRRKRRRAGAAFTSVLALLVVGSLWNAPQRSEAPPKSSVAVLAPVRQVLPDGTVVELKDSASIALEFTTTQRRITLDKGTAHFQVTKDPARPFTVAASGIEVRAVGTAFTVDHQAQRVEVLVTAGLVAVVPSKPAISAPADPAASNSAILVNGGEVVAVGVESREVISPVSSVGE